MELETNRILLPPAYCRSFRQSFWRCPGGMPGRNSNRHPSPHLRKETAMRQPLGAQEIISSSRTKTARCSIGSWHSMSAGSALSSNPMPPSWATAAISSTQRASNARPSEEWSIGCSSRLEVSRKTARSCISRSIRRRQSSRTCCELRRGPLFAQAQLQRGSQSRNRLRQKMESLAHKLAVAGSCDLVAPVAKFVADAADGVNETLRTPSSTFLRR